MQSLSRSCGFPAPKCNGSLSKQGNSHNEMTEKPWYEDINEIKQRCRSSGTLFEDPNFPAVDSSAFHLNKPPRSFEWKRPGEIVDKPCMFVDGASRLDINQGLLGDCWFLAAIASLTRYPNLLERIIPSGQEFDKDYCGAFVFNFWYEGKWIDVTVDDRLPTYNNQLVFTHSKEKNEFWSALLEKAYAKLSGSYEALKGGQTIEAMEDFTGGLGETFELGSKTPANLFEVMQKALSMGSLMGCSINAKPYEIEAKLSNGLVKGHAYTVTGAEKVNAKTRGGLIQVELIRVRNPWGNDREWRGAWGDRSYEWKLLSDEEKKAINLIFEDDGEFWMSFRDFITNFSTLEICMLGPDSSLVEGKRRNWEGRSEFGRWRRGVSAGGCRNFLDTFAKNPQFSIDLKDPDEEDDEDTCSFVVALMQIGRRKLRAVEGKPHLTIGFAIYKFKEEDLKDGVLDKDYFRYNGSVARSKVFINSREIVGRFSLPPGSYAVVPSTYKPNEEGNFLVRLYSEKKYETKHCDVKTTVKNYAERKPIISRKENEILNTQFKSLFFELAGEDREIDAFELQEILTSTFNKEMGGQQFSLEACRSLVSLQDTDCNGKLGFEEFKVTWFQLMKWRSVFHKHDKDNSGNFDTWELNDALKEIGITLDSTALAAAVSRFRSKNNVVTYDDYVQIIVRLFAMYDAFQQNVTSMSLCQFLCKTIRL